MIYVTHDQVEAMTMGDRIVVLKDGHVQQIAPPLELYQDPANRFVGEFIGSPAMNTLDGTALTGAAAPMFSFGQGHTAELPFPVADGAITMGVRPEHVYLASYHPRATRVTSPIAGVLDVIEPMGNEIVAYVAVGEERIVCRLEPQALPPAGDAVKIVFDLDHLHVFDAASGQTLTPQSAPA